MWPPWSNNDEKWKSRLTWRVKRCLHWDFWQSCSTVVHCLPPLVDVVDKRRTRQESGGGVHRFLQALGPTVFQVQVVCGAFEEVDVALIMSRTIELSIIFLRCVLTRVVCFDGSGTESSCFEGREAMLQTFAEASLRVEILAVTRIHVLGIRRWSCTISVCTVLPCYSHSQGDTT